jgi:DNA processing protein
MLTKIAELSEEKRTLLILMLRQIPGVGNVTLRRLFDQMGSVEAVLGAANLTELLGQGEQGSAWMVANSKWSALPTTSTLPTNDRVIDWFNDDYPAGLKQLPDPPMVIFTRGTLDAMAGPKLAIVGTRTPDNAAQSYAETLAFRLAQAGNVIVSGFAAGIDKAAHYGTMRANGRTIAVLGCSLDAVSMPSSSPDVNELRNYTMKQGLFLTEQTRLLGSQSRNAVVAALMARNRIIAALADATIVIASSGSGGALHTAERARRLGKRVWIVDWRDNRYLGNLKLLLGGAGSLPDEPYEAAEVIINASRSAYSG